MNSTFRLLVGLLLTLALSKAADLKPDTVTAFDQYIAATEARLEPKFHGDGFLWSDDSAEARKTLQQGAIAIHPQRGNGTTSVKGGLIEDWLGAVFVPHARMKDVLALAQDYDRHGEVYKPDLQDTRLLSRSGDDFHMRMRVFKTKFFLTAVFNVERDIHFTALDDKREYSRSYSQRIAEVSDPGKPGERELPVGQDRGLLWRLYAYWFYEERDGGVYIDCESISLTRDLPFALRTVFGPIIQDLPGESVHTGLDQTRRAILSGIKKP
jgi:hypothetical protein